LPVAIFFVNVASIRTIRIQWKKLMQRILRITAIVFLLSLVVFAEFHEPTRFAHTLQKLAHPVTFGAIALLFLTLLRGERPRRFGSYVVAFALTVCCGAGTELAQAFVARDPSMLDVLRDALGAGTALAGFATLVPGTDARGRGKWRMMGALLTCVGFAGMVTPISICIAAYAHRDLRFPTLLEACSPLDRYFLSGGSAKFVPSIGATRSPCGSVLQVELGTVPNAGITLDEPYPDWRTAHTLVLDLRNPGDFELSLVVRVHDHAHNHQFQDRFNREFTLRAHEQLEIAIPITEIEHAPASRLMNLAQIAGIILFRDHGATAGNFEVERILLRPPSAE
jgi:VanZ family protein